MAEETEETIYDEEGREGMVDDSEISPEEEGFMNGYDNADEEEKHEEEPEEDKDKNQEEE